MRRYLMLLLAVMGASALAQQNVTVGGVIMSQEPLPEGTRVGVHVVNLDGETLQEIASSAPVAGTFSVTAEDLPPGEALQRFRSGAVPLPGLQNEYRVSPDDVDYARALTKVYVDNNGNGAYDSLTVDTGFLGIARIEDPTGFFVLLYVDKDATLSGRGHDLELKAGWNVFTARFPEGGDPVYEVSQRLDDAVLDIFIQ